MPRIPPENVRPAGSLLPPENAPPVVEIPEEEEAPGGIPAGYERLTAGGAISPTLGTTEIAETNATANVNFTLADGTEDGQMKFIYIFRDLAEPAVAPKPSRTVRCNLYRKNNSNYTAIQTAFRMHGPGCWALLRWTTGIPTTSGDRALWVISANSGVVDSDQAREPSARAFSGVGSGTETGDAVEAWIFGNALVGIPMPLEGTLRLFRFTYQATENMTDVEFVVYRNGSILHTFEVGPYSSSLPLDYTDGITQTFAVDVGEVIQIKLGAGIATAGVANAGVSFELVPVGGEPIPFITILDGTIPS